MERMILRGILYVALLFACLSFVMSGDRSNESDFRQGAFIVGVIAALAISARPSPAETSPARTAKPATEGRREAA